MPTLQDVQTWKGLNLQDNDGDKIGEIVDVYLDRQSGEPEWLAVKTGLFGSNVSFVPIREARGGGDGVTVPYEKSLVKDAPHAEADGELSPEEERRLYEHYSLEFGDFDYEKEYEAPRDYANEEGGPGHDTSGPNTDNAMTRSEEELRVGKTQTEVGRARLRKFIVTENVETTVPVQREEVRIEREPITDGNVDDALDGPALSEEEHEVTLHAEQPVVEKNVVPKERVRLEKDTFTEEQTVTDEVRKERIEADGDTGRR
ncbi:MAG: putative conserved domain protein [uncultured Solirubrobacteraceae bacterium]|uniref:Putative conserved domain protein n=1 Tax=uncultured Solirubrobacteraceae bacterium TaxID=1162706 RepID=A0A6J4TB10_9ACTN|nr:MAG: putative conserved domain protein [uncultured Solirubrobacteraceae bacterium]